MLTNSLNQFVEFMMVDDEGEPLHSLDAATITELTYTLGSGPVYSLSVYDRTISDAWIAGGLINLTDGGYRVGIPNDAWLHVGRFILRGEQDGQHLIFTPIPIIASPQADTTTDNGVIGPTDAYRSTADSDLYFQTKLHVRAWDRASQRNRNVSGVEATRLIDSLNYAGIKVDPNQPHQFPRKSDPVCINGVLTSVNTDSAVPVAIGDAQNEIQLALLDGVDVEKEYKQLLLSSTGLNGVRDTYDRTSIPEHILAGIPSIVAWRLLKPYLRAAQELKIHRV